MHDQTLAKMKLIFPQISLKNTDSFDKLYQTLETVFHILDQNTSKLVKKLG